MLIIFKYIYVKNKNAHFKHFPLLKFSVNSNYALCQSEWLYSYFCTFVSRTKVFAHIHFSINWRVLKQNAFFINVILLYSTMEKTWPHNSKNFVFRPLEKRKKKNDREFILRGTWQHFCLFPVNLVPLPKINGAVF